MTDIAGLETCVRLPADEVSARVAGKTAARVATFLNTGFSSLRLNFA